MDDQQPGYLNHVKEALILALALVGLIIGGIELLRSKALLAAGLLAVSLGVVLLLAI